VIKLLFIVAWRNFCRDKLTSSIQLLGLIIGISSFVLIHLYVDHQKSYNTAFSDAKDIYRVNLIRGENKPQAQVPLRLAKELTQNFTEVEDATRVSPSNVSIKHQQSVYSERVLYGDVNYFSFFDFQLIEGDINTALDAPDSLVLHQDLAIKYFSSTTGVIGKRLIINGKAHQVTGVIQKPTIPTTMPLTMILPMVNFYGQISRPEWIDAWNFNATRTYVKIRQPSAINALTQRISDYYDSRAKGLSSFKTNRVTIQPLLDIYLDNITTKSLTPPSSAVMVMVFSIIALMILLLACVNFTNLSTAAAMRRGKDVGVRKALGASKRQLMGQYLSEAVMLSAIACLFSVALVYLCLPAFNQLMNVDIIFSVTFSQLLQLLALSLLVGILAGSYPAFYLSHLSPAHVLKGLMTTSTAAVFLKQALIILQFAIATFLLVSSLVVNWQMKYINTMEQGFEREGVIVVSRGDSIYNAFKSQILRHPDVISVTMSHTVPTKATRTSNTVRRLDDISNEIRVGNNPVSLDFFKTYGIQLLSGRVFSNVYINDAYQENTTDWQSSKGKLVINQTLAASLGWSAEEAVGQILTLGGGQDGLHNHQVIGVVADSHYVNVKNIVDPMTYVLAEQPKDLALRWTSIRLKKAANVNSLNDIKEIWLGLSPELAFKYDWVVDLFDSSYRNENQQTDLLNLFSLLAVVVTAIGLFGLAAFTTQRRVKEIAIRKILGASTRQLCFMLVNQFSSLVIIANVISLPLAYLLMRDWLNNFIYRIDMPYSAFMISTAFSLVIAYITVMVIAYRAATAKPVNSLHCE